MADDRIEKLIAEEIVRSAPQYLSDYRNRAADALDAYARRFGEPAVREVAVRALDELAQFEREREPWNREAGSLAESRARVVRSGRFDRGGDLTAAKVADWASRTRWRG